ncbi:hypothetical protein K523DRAFT_379475 [Schizophyllum commune Tattone D]|nr:hypothetical protein K523DRAFT_379475 [Schizophyllum commune Tattone D]
MSNTLTNLVPNFNGKEFKSYANKMEAYLLFQGIDYILTEDKLSSSCSLWLIDARGAIVMRIDERIIDNIPKEDMKTAKKLWAYLKKEYGKAQLANIFGYLQTALNTQFNERQHPDPQLNVVIQQFTPRDDFSPSELSEGYAQSLNCLRCAPGYHKWMQGATDG